MEKKLYSIDIETVSQGKKAIDFTDSAYYKAAANIKDPVKIAANIQKQKDTAQGKHGLHWTVGKVLSVAVVDCFGGEYDMVYFGHDEAKILTDLANKIESNGSLYLIGKTSQDFDYPFLVGRYMALNLPVPRLLRRSKFLLDSDKFFGYRASSGQTAKLDHYAHGIDYAGKPMHGGQVQELYNTIMAAEMEGDTVAANAGWKQLADYNVHDCNVVKELARRYYGCIEEVC